MNYTYPKMIHTSDGIIKTQNGKIVLIKRGYEPFKDYWALPGGIVEESESVEEALIREMKEEAGVLVIPREILGVFSAPNRDPRGRVISTVFICDSESDQFHAGDDAKELQIISLDQVHTKKLAFDHKFILECYYRWIEIKSTFWSYKFNPTD
ncbi:MAG: NUDIX hydrolase [Candidatus Heimdallarchaeota archaeon]|nr:NUDIX hydrolase [Candidatus Heimdallarchaeota archaeon]